MFSGTLALLLGEVVARSWLAPDLHWFQPVFARDGQVGYTLRPGDHGHVLGAPLRANALGYRGPEWTLAKDPERVRVALLGDSNAFGYGVAEECAVGAVLERELARRRGGPVEVLDFALPGYTARQELAVLEHKALPFAPDVVVLVLCDNDERPELWVDTAGWLRGGVPDDESAGRADATFMPSARFGPLQKSRLLGYLKLQQLRRTMAVSPPGPGWNLPVAAGDFADVLRREVYVPVCRMIARCRTLGVPTVVALFGQDPEYRRLLATLAVAERVPAVDLVTLFPECASWNDLLLRYGLGWDPHLGAAAHARWGQALADAVGEALDAWR